MSGADSKSSRVQQGSILGISFLTIFAGLALILQDRITELTIGGVGTIKAASSSAISDAEAISELRKRVENQSATVDLVAKAAGEAQATSVDANAALITANEKIKQANNAIENSKKTIDKLNYQIEFSEIIINAQNDDRASYDKLKQIYDQHNSQNSELAGRAWNTIFELHSGPMSQSGFKVPWNDGIDPSKIGLSDLSGIYGATPPPLRPAVLEYIWNRSDIPKYDRLNFLLAVMKTDSSVTAMEYAGRYFTSGAGLKIKPMALSYLENWWTEHSHEFLSP